MLKKTILISMLLILAWGFWISPNFKEIAAGVAIFLFGMLFLEEGFRAFTGGVLEKLLRKTTNTTWKSLSFGIVSTTVMQSSSLVSVITISFLSAGLIGLAAGIGIIFGANLGTTTGAWLIAGLGMKVKISAYAMPMLVFGVIGIFQKSKALQGIGYILAGLGFLFLGIHYMKEGFEAFRDTIDLTAFAVSGYAGIFLFTLIGVAATVIMQSSHATLVIIITALAAEQITYENALALAIGANIGTTITAIIGSMSANIQGKRLAIAHLIFNVVTAFIAIVLIYQIAALVDWFSASVGIAEDNYTLKLAVFHTIFNTLGVVIMMPFIHALANSLNEWMPEKQAAKDAPIYLTQSVEELPDTAIEAVRKETLHLFDNASDIIAKALSLQKNAIFSEKDLSQVIKAQHKAIFIDFDQAYQASIKGLYSEIIAFISRTQSKMNQEQNEELFALRAAARDIVEAIKDVKHLHKNLSNYIASDNLYIRDEYNKLRLYLADLMRHLDQIRREGDDPAVILSLDNLKLKMQENDATVNGHLEYLIREGKISPNMATSLMNDVAYANDIKKNLIQMSESLFAIGDSGMKLAERSIALTDDELAEVLKEKQ